MSKTTTALVVKEVNGPISQETITLSALHPDEALVEIAAVGICHTDLACMDGSLPGTFPGVYGHEGAGVVKEVGSEIKHVAPGDKVLLSYAFCGECPPCKDQHTAYCLSFMPHNFGGVRASDGTTALKLSDGKMCHANFFGQSSFMRDAVVHRSSIVKVAADTDLALMAPLGCGLQTGAGCVINTLKVTPGSTLVVFGVGAVGMAAVMAGKIQRAGKIIAVDLHQSRLDHAKQVGATDVVVGSDPDVLDKIRALCPPNGANFACDCTGVPKVIETMIECLGTMGKASSVGAPAPGLKTNLEVLSFLIMGKEYVGCIEGDSNTSEFIPYLIEQHKKGSFPFQDMVKYYDVKDVTQAIEDSKSGKTIKAVLRW